MKNISFAYRGTNLEELSVDKAFNEEDFKAKLEKIFKTKLQIDFVDLVVSKEGSRFNIKIEVRSPNLKNNFVEENGFEAAETVRRAIDKVIKNVYDQKDKMNK